MLASRVRTLGLRALAVLFAAGSTSLAVSTLVAGGGCSEKPPPGSAPPPIIIGVSLGLTNDLKTFAAPLRDSVRAAEGTINAGGGLLGRPVQFEVIDDQSNEDEYVKKVANELIGKGAVAIIGPIGSQQVVLTHQIYADRQLVQITPSATSTDLTKIQSPDNRFLFRTTPADDFQGAAVINFAKKTPLGLQDGGAPVVDGGVPTCKRLAIVAIDNAYGNAMADVIVKNFANDGQGRAVIGPKIVPATEKPEGYKAEVDDILVQNPQCLALIAYEKVAAAFTREFKTNPQYPTLEQNGFFFIGTDGVFTPGFLDLSSEERGNLKAKNFAEGFYGTNPDTNPVTREYSEFKTIFASYFPLNGQDAPAFTANTFDAAILIAFAIQKVGRVNDPVAIRDAVREVATPPGRPFTPAEIGEALAVLREGGDIDYRGASGNVDFDMNGNVRSGFIVWQALRIDGGMEYKTVGRFTTEELAGQIQ